MGTSPLSSVPEGQAAQSRLTTTAGFLASLKAADDQMTSFAGRQYAGDPFAMTSDYIVSFLLWSLTFNAW